MTGLDLILRFGDKARVNNPNLCASVPLWCNSSRRRMREWALRWRSYVAAGEPELATDSLSCAIAWRNREEVKA